MHEELDSVLSYGMGWVLPDGSVLACHLHEHLEKLSKCSHPIADLVKKRLDALSDTLDEGEADFRSRIGPDQHPEWHNYEIWADDIKQETKTALIRELYDSGCVRLGINRGGLTGCVVELEGTPDAVRRAKSVAVYLEQSLIQDGQTTHISRQIVANSESERLALLKPILDAAAQGGERTWEQAQSLATV